MKIRRHPTTQWNMKTWGGLVRNDEILLVASAGGKPWGQPGLDYAGDGFDFERWAWAVDVIHADGVEALPKRTKKLKEQLEQLAVYHPWDKEFLIQGLVDAVGEERIIVSEMLSGRPSWESLEFAGVDFWKTYHQMPEWKRETYSAIKGREVKFWSREALFGVANLYIAWINENGPLKDWDLRLRFMDDIRPIAEELVDRGLATRKWWGKLWNGVSA